MFESLAAPIINQILGQYIENVDSSRIQLSVWSGNVVLQNVRLRKEALNQFKLPVQVEEGYLGELTLSIPWNDIKNKPVKIFVNNLLILASPKGDVDYDKEAEDLYLHKVKMDKLAAMESSLKNTNMTSEQNSTFVSQLITKIVDNLQFCIKNIHIRLEDRKSFKLPFSIGISITELSAYSTDENWKEAFISGDTNIIYKFLKLSHFAMYWNTTSETFGKKSPSEFISCLSDSIISDSSTPNQWQYVLEPVKGTGKVKICKKPIENEARYTTTLDFEDLGFVLDDEQYSTLFSLMHSFNMYQISSKYRQYRPPMAMIPSKHPKLWFQYAIKCILSDIHERNVKWTWPYFKERRDDRKKYMELYSLAQKNGLNPQQFLELEMLERKLSYGDLRLYRHLSSRQTKVSIPLPLDVLPASPNTVEVTGKTPTDNSTASTTSTTSPTPPNTSTNSWSSWWYGPSTSTSTSPTTTKDTSSESTLKLDSNQLKQIYETIDFDPSAIYKEDTSSPEDILVDISWKLKTGSFSIKKDPHVKNEILFQLLFDGVSATAIQRPTSWFFVLDLLNLSLNDHTIPHSLYPQLMTAKKVLETSSSPFFSLCLEVNPLDLKADNALKLTMLPLEIVINPSTIETAIAFFRPPKLETDSFYVIQALAKDTIDSLAQQTKSGLDFAIEKHKTLELVIEADAPIFLFPESMTDPSSWSILVNAGHLAVKTPSISKEEKKKKISSFQTGSLEMLNEAQSFLYDEFQIDLTCVEVIVNRSGACLEYIQSRRFNPEQTLSTRDQFIEPINLSLCIESCIIPKLNEFAKLKIKGALERVHMNLNDVSWQISSRILSKTVSVLSFSSDHDSAKEASAKESRNVNPVVGRMQSVVDNNANNVSETFLADLSTIKDEEEEEFQDANEELDSPNSSSIVQTTNQVNLFFLFDIQEISLVLIHQDKDNYNPISEITLNNLNVEMESRQYDSNLSVKIKSIELLDKMYDCGSLLKPLTCPEQEQEYLLDLIYRSCQDDSPSFDGVHDTCELNIASMSLKLAADPILKVYDFVLNMVTLDSVPMANPMANPMDSIPINHPINVTEIKSHVKETHNDPMDPTPINKSINKKKSIYKINLHKIILEFQDSRSILATVHFETLNLNLENNLQSTPQTLVDSIIVNGSIGKLFITDHSHTDDTYHQVLKIEGNRLVDFVFESLKLESGVVQTSLKVITGSMRFLYSPLFMNRFLQFLSHFSKMYFLMEQARQSALDSATTIANNSNRFELNVSVESPIIVLSRKSFRQIKGPDMLLNLYPGRMSIVNHPDSEWKNVSIHMTEMKVTSCELISGKLENLYNIIQSCRLDIDFNSNQSMSLIDAKLSDLHLVTDQDQYDFLVEIYRGLTFSPSSTTKDETTKDETKNDTTNNLKGQKEQKELGLDISSKILLSFGNITVDLVGKRSLGSIEQCQIQLLQPQIQYDSYSNHSSKVEITIDQAILRNKKSNRVCFRDMISAKESLVSHKQIVISYSSPPFGSTSFVCIWESIVCLLSLEFISFVIGFFSQPWFTTLHPYFTLTSEKAPSSYSNSYQLILKNPEIILLDDATNPTTEALVISSPEITLGMDALIMLSAQPTTLYLTSMDLRKELAVKLVEDVTWSVTMDYNIESETLISVDVSPILLRMSFTDIPIFYRIILKTFTFVSDSTLDSKDEPPMAPVPSTGSTVSIPSTATITTNHQIMKFDLREIRFILTDDTSSIHLPMFDILINKISLDISDWSSNLTLNSIISMQAKHFNLHNSHWEPLIESFSFSFSYKSNSETSSSSVALYSNRKIEFVLSHACMDYMFSVYPLLQSSELRDLLSRSGEHCPYVLRNQTGYPIFLWTESTSGDGSDTQIHSLGDGESMPYFFEDWRKIGNIHGPTWETIKHISVDKEGLSLFPLLPRMNNVTHLMVSQVYLQEKIKMVALRSPNLVINKTLLPLEMKMCNDQGLKIGKSSLIPPGSQVSVPLGSAYFNSVCIRPQGFGYDWSLPIGWRELQEKKTKVVNCNAKDGVPCFIFRVISTQELSNHNNSLYPLINMTIQAPLLIENLLAFDIKYLLYDHTTNQEHRDSIHRGEMESLHIVDPSHTLGLGIQVLETEFKPSGVVLIANAEQSDFCDDSIELIDPQGRVLNLVLYRDLDFGFKLEIYCPYLLLNRTGIDLYFRAKSLLGITVVGKSVSKGLDTSIPFMFSYKNMESFRGRVQASVDNFASASKPFSLEAVGSSFDLAIPTRSSGALVHVGVSIQEGEGKFYKTKVITFTPRIILSSGLSSDLECRMADSTSSILLKAGSQLQLTHFSEMEEGIHTIQVRLQGTAHLWSKSFIVNQIGRIYVKCGQRGSTMEDLMRVDISLVGATFFVFFYTEVSRWPFRIDNESEEDVVVWQDCPQKNTYLIPRKISLPYAWDEPSAERKQLIISVNGKEKGLDLMQIGRRDPLKLDNRVLAIHVIAEGPMIVLKLFTETTKRRGSTSSTFGSSADIFAYAKDKGKDKRGSMASLKSIDTVQVRKPMMDINIHLEGIGLSLINQKLQELLYLSAKDVEWNYSESNLDRLYALGIQWIQIDNQLPDAMDPIFLFPSILSKNETTKARPVIMASMCRSKDVSFGVEYYEWLTVLLQELSILLDEEFLQKLIEFNDFPSLYDSKKPTLIPVGLSVSSSFKSFEEDPLLYFDRFLLHPVQFNVSFTKTQLAKKKNQRQSAKILNFLYDILTMTLGNIHDAPIRLNALELEHANAHSGKLIPLILTFYTQEIVGQLHKVVGSADVLGNPVGLFNTLSSGVSDLFYEPLQGLEIMNPQDFGIGVAKGTASLVKKTVYGVSDTLSKFTGSISKGLSVITMDEKYQQSRMTRNKPKHAMSGVAKGTASFVNSIGSGLSGIVSKPFEGAKEEGVGGFFKGFGKGIVGVVTKPIVGVFDLASNVTEGIKNTTTVFDKELDRIRLPRYTGKNGVITNYNPREALGWSWLMGVENGKYAKEDLKAHLQLNSDDLAILITEARILLIKILRSRIKLEWELEYKELQVIKIENGDLCLYREYSRFPLKIPCPDLDVAKWLSGKMEEAFSQFLIRIKAESY